MRESQGIEDEEKFNTQSIALSISPSEGGVSRYESGFNMTKIKVAKQVDKGCQT